MTRMIKFKALSPDAILPQFAYMDDLGCDFAIIGDHTLNPGESRDLPSGLAAEPPPGYGLRITGRSSTLRKLGLRVNEGIIDGGYRGELKTYVTNENAVPVSVKHGTRLAQLIPAEIVNCETAWADELAPSARGEQGFGSTGTSGTPDAQTLDTEALIYLGGAIDYVGEQADVWRHAERWHNGQFGVTVFCPLCNGKDKAMPTIMAENARALARARFAVFDLRAYSVGTPIEAWTKTGDFGYITGPKAVVLIHPAAPGLFVREMVNRGALVVADEAGARAVVRQKVAEWALLK